MAGQAGLVGMWMSCKTDNWQLDIGLTIDILSCISVCIGGNYLSMWSTILSYFCAFNKFSSFFCILSLRDINHEQFNVVIPLVVCSKTTIGNIS